MSSFVKIVLLIGIMVGTSIQSVFKKAYNKRGYSSVFIFGSITVASAALFFVASAKYPLSFSADILPYAFGFAAAYCGIMIAFHLKFKTASKKGTLIFIRVPFLQIT